MADGAERLTRDEQAAASRNAILDAALVLFADHGFAGTSTKRIANAAGVSEGLIFHHFPTKQDVLRAIVESRRTMPAMVGALLRDNPEMPVSDFVRTITTRYVMLLRPGQPEARLFRMMIGEAHRNEELYAFLQTIQDTLLPAVAEYFRGRIAAGELRDDLPVVPAARSLFGALLIFFFLNHRLEAEAWDTQAAAHAQGVAEFWLGGALASMEGS